MALLQRAYRLFNGRERAHPAPLLTRTIGIAIWATFVGILMQGRRDPVLTSAAAA